MTHSLYPVARTNTPNHKALMRPMSSLGLLTSALLASTLATAAIDVPSAKISNTQRIVRVNPQNVVNPIDNVLANGNALSDGDALSGRTASSQSTINSANDTVNNANDTVNKGINNAQNATPQRVVSNIRQMTTMPVKTVTVPLYTTPMQTATPARPSSLATSSMPTARPVPASPALTNEAHRPVYNHGELANNPIFNAPNLATLTTSPVPAPQVTLSAISYLQTVLIPATINSTPALDVSLVDEFIKEMIPRARHYPPNFDNKSKRYYAKQDLKTFEQELRPVADNPNASYEVLIRAATLNGMARNLDLGSDYAVRASNYVARALERRPNSPEANFLYGMMLAEGGGFNEGAKYLNKAVAEGSIEAEQSLAQTDLLTDKRPQALARLQRLHQRYPDNDEISRQLQIVQNGEYYIWDLPSD